MNLPYSRIILNTVPDRYKQESLLRVLPHTSPLPLQKEVERMARYFQREFQYDSLQYHRKDVDPSCRAYLFRDGEIGQPVWAGACCFQMRENLNNHQNIQTLDWVWIHPFYRHQGLFTQAWPTLQANHGDFAISQPISPTMRAFLLKHNCNSKYSALYGE